MDKRKISKISRPCAAPDILEMGSRLANCATHIVTAELVEDKKILLLNFFKTNSLASGNTEAEFRTFLSHEDYITQDLKTSKTKWITGASAVASLPDPLYLYQLPMLQLLGEAFGKGGCLMLEIKNLTVKVKNDAPILTDVSLSIDKGTCIGLTGASGSGKTTLIKSIMGMNGGDLEVPQGQILLDGDDLLKRSAKERRGLCGKTIGFIPQNPMTAFFPHAKMDRQIIETLRMHTGTDKKQARELAENVLRKVNLTDTKRVLRAYPGELSGGMLQRIAMALILGTKPKYVLADEPTSALDEANRDLLLELLREYQKNAAILFISHDTEAMKALCSITHVMEHGEIIETQATEQLFIHPQQPWTKCFAEAACHREEVNWKWTALN